MRLVLASASPRRADLLRAAGFAFEILPVDVDEGVHGSEEPRAYVQRLASEKSARALERLAEPVSVESGTAGSASESPGRFISVPTGDVGAEQVVILGADTVVLVDEEIFGKPVDDRDAGRMLRRLSGRSHQVMTGISLRTLSHEVKGVETTTVEFSPLTDADMDWYLASTEGRDKAGAYAIQGLASRFVRRIDGSYSNVVGLPVAAVYKLLTEIASRP